MVVGDAGPRPYSDRARNRTDHASHSEALDLDRGFLLESHFSVVCAAGAVPTLPEVIGGLGPDFIGSSDNRPSAKSKPSHPMGRFGPVRRIALTDVVFEDRWGQPYRD